VKPDKEEAHAAVDEYGTNGFEPPDLHDAIGLSKEHLPLEFN